MSHYQFSRTNPKKHSFVGDRDSNNDTRSKAYALKGKDYGINFNDKKNQLIIEGEGPVKGFRLIYVNPVTGEQQKIEQMAASGQNILQSLVTEKQWRAQDSYRPRLVQLIYENGTKTVRLDNSASLSSIIIKSPVGTPKYAPKNAILRSLLAKDVLTTAEIRVARALIAKEEGAATKISAYRALQYKTPYINERKSVAPVTEKEQKRSVLDKFAEHDVYGGMCNMSSLAMGLECMGINNPNKSKLYHDALEEYRAYKAKDKSLTLGGFTLSGDREDSNTWLALAVAVGRVANIEIEVYEDLGWMHFNETSARKLCDPILDAGGFVILGIYGNYKSYQHVVRLVDITKQGLIVDDPNGQIDHNYRSYKSGSGKLNSGRDDKENTVFGRHNLWTWAQLSAGVESISVARFLPKTGKSH